MHTPSNLLLHHFVSTPGIGPRTLKTLWDQYDETSPIETFLDSLLQENIFSSSKIYALQKALLDFSPKECTRNLDQYEIQLVSLKDDDYPPLLREIPDAPPLLYVRGNRSNLIQNTLLSLVGTRKPTRYGIDVARSLSRELAHMGITTVSGMALGLDGEVHRGTLEGNGLTVAVLGNGLSDSCIAPRTHFSLMNDIIASGGTIVSELPPSTKASPGTFPMRNRIVAGMTRATLIIEASRRSGTLITAELALDYNREVLAIPGSIFSPLSEGPHYLIRSGATLVHTIQDIIALLDISREARGHTKDTSQLQDTEKKIYTLLEDGPKNREEITKIIQISASELGINLTILEMNGFIKDIGNGTYRKI